MKALRTVNLIAAGGLIGAGIVFSSIHFTSLKPDSPLIPEYVFGQQRTELLIKLGIITISPLLYGVLYSVINFKKSILFKIHLFSILIFSGAMSYLMVKSNSNFIFKLNSTNFYAIVTILCLIGVLQILTCWNKIVVEKQKNPAVLDDWVSNE